MLKLKLKAKIRKQRPNVLRRQGWLPAVLYGPKIKQQVLQIDALSFDKVFRQAGESTLINLEVEPGTKKANPEGVLVLVHDIQKDPVSDKVIHIDFYAPRLDKTMHVKVPLVFAGQSLAIEDLDGTLVKNIQEIEIEVLPQDLPHEIKVDIASLKTFEDKIFVKDLALPKGVRVLTGGQEIIALVMPPRSEEELAALEEAPEEKIEEVEVVSKETKEEEAVGEAATTKETTGTTK